MQTTNGYVTLAQAAQRTGFTKHWIMQLAKKGRVGFRVVEPYGYRAYSIEDLDKIRS